MRETPLINSCANCGLPFGIANRAHRTYCDFGLAAPLCEDCWSTLTPETRAPFYWDHILTARLDQPVALAIMQAVADGK